MKIIWLNISGQKQWIQHVMSKIEYISDLSWRKQHMSSLREEDPTSLYFHQFWYTCYILNNKLYLIKFDVKAYRGIFLGYSERSQAYIVSNSEKLCVEESMHVKFDDKEPGNETPKLDFLLKVTVNKKALIILKHLLQLQDWKQSSYFYPMLLIMA